MSNARNQKELLRPGVIVLSIALLAALPLACTREAPAPPDEGSQVSQNEQTAEPAPEQAPAPEQTETAPPVRPAPAPQPRAAAPAPRPAPAYSSPAPAAPRPPQMVALSVPEGTTLKVKLEDALDSGTSQPGDHFSATLEEPVVVGDRVVLPAGATVDGTVTEVIPAKKGMKESGGALTLSFEQIGTSSGDMVPMAASLSKVAKSTKKKAGTIGGAAAGGALLGKVLGGSTKDAAIGAVVGGAIGTGVAAGTKGTEMKLEAGTSLTITLEQPLTVHLKR